MTEEEYRMASAEFLSGIEDWEKALDEWPDVICGGFTETGFPPLNLAALKDAVKTDLDLTQHMLSLLEEEPDLNWLEMERMRIDFPPCSG